MGKEKKDEEKEEEEQKNKNKKNFWKIAPRMKIFIKLQFGIPKYTRNFFYFHLLVFLDTPFMM